MRQSFTTFSLFELHIPINIFICTLHITNRKQDAHWSHSSLETAPSSLSLSLSHVFLTSNTFVSTSVQARGPSDTGVRTSVTLSTGMGALTVVDVVTVLGTSVNCMTGVD